MRKINKFGVWGLEEEGGSKPNKWVGRGLGKLTILSSHSDLLPPFWVVRDMLEVEKKN